MNLLSFVTIYLLKFTAQQKLRSESPRLKKKKKSTHIHTHTHITHITKYITQIQHNTKPHNICTIYSKQKNILGI